MKPIWFEPTVPSGTDKIFGESPKLRFQIQPLNKMQLWELQDYYRNLDGRLMLMAKGRQFALRCGLRDWDVEIDGSSIPIPETLPQMAEKLPPFLLDVVAMEIINISNLNGDQVKN